MPAQNVNKIRRCRTLFGLRIFHEAPAPSLRTPNSSRARWPLMAFSLSLLMPKRLLGFNQFKKQSTVCGLIKAKNKFKKQFAAIKWCPGTIRRGSDWFWVPWSRSVRKNFDAFRSIRGTPEGPKKGNPQLTEEARSGRLFDVVAVSQVELFRMSNFGQRGSAANACFECWKVFKCKSRSNYHWYNHKQCLRWLLIKKQTNSLDSFSDQIWNMKSFSLFGHLLLKKFLGAGKWE